MILAGGDFTLIPSRFEPCGLVDYEASLVGNLVIGRATGGLTKVRQCAYLYEWLDISDRAGEANALWWQIKAAIDNYRHNPAHHAYLIHTAMTLNTSWDASAGQYVEMYRYALLFKQWRAKRQQLLESFTRSLKSDRALFSEFFAPGQQEYSDWYDWELKRFLAEHSA